LVRSNNHGSIGFLKEAQRVNVLMSRARFGMYLIGNAQTLTASAKGSAVWSPIIERMESLGQLQAGLPTRCQLHPEDEPILLKQPSDFRKYRPNGGCERPCSFRMDCGHTCSLSCHPFDRAHTTVQRDCCEPCPRVPPECALGHRCPKLCKDKCGRCRAAVGPTRLLGCNHLKDLVYCHEIRNEEAMVELSKHCSVLVPYDFSKCGHHAETVCSNAKSESPVCPVQCGRIVPECNHSCSNPCALCTDGNHRCNQLCQRQLFCGHSCGQPCHPKSDCPPCRQKCAVKCCHSSCPKLCHATVSHFIQAEPHHSDIFPTWHLRSVLLVLSFARGNVPTREDAHWFAELLAQGCPAAR
jgi:AAA domain